MRPDKTRKKKQILFFSVFLSLFYPYFYLKMGEKSHESDQNQVKKAAEKGFLILILLLIGSQNALIIGIV